MAAFKRIVKKEPKYRSEHPFRAVVNLGSQEYAFALDVVPPPAKEAKADDKKTKKDEKPKTRSPSRVCPATFNRLYFDLNHNGDLSDDKPHRRRARRRARSGWGRLFQFPARRSRDRRRRGPSSIIPSSWKDSRSAPRGTSATSCCR